VATSSTAAGEGILHLAEQGFHVRKSHSAEPRETVRRCRRHGKATTRSFTELRRTRSVVSWHNSNDVRPLWTIEARRPGIMDNGRPVWMRPEQQFRTVLTSEKGVALHLRGPPITAASRWCPIYPEFFVKPVCAAQGLLAARSMPTAPPLTWIDTFRRCVPEAS
jgi:hypothetical protein